MGQEMGMPLNMPRAFPREREQGTSRHDAQPSSRITDTKTAPANDDANQRYEIETINYCLRYADMLFAYNINLSPPLQRAQPLSAPQHQRALLLTAVLLRPLHATAIRSSSNQLFAQPLSGGLSAVQVKTPMSTPCSLAWKLPRHNCPYSAFSPP